MKKILFTVLYFKEVFAYFFVQNAQKFIDLIGRNMIYKEKILYNTDVHVISFWETAVPD